MRHVTYISINQSTNLFGAVVARMSASGDTNESQIWMSRDTHINKTCHINVNKSNHKFIRGTCHIDDCVRLHEPKKTKKRVMSFT